jgi:tRNA G10  N-methylase Trm11
MDKVREWGLTGMSNLWLSWIRRAVYMVAGLANSSFYRPHLSRQICMMTGKEHGTVFDPCMGWGGRMLGVTSLGWNYIGCDPNTETYNNLHKIANFVDIGKQVSLLNIGAEDYSYKGKHVDVVVTSPPYFNLEVYNNEEDQSYNEFTSYEAWRDGWYVPLIENCLSIIKDDGISAWNVMNFKKNDLVGDLIATHEKHGWKLVDTVGFNSPLANIRKLKNKDVTYLFKKV